MGSNREPDHATGVIITAQRQRQRQRQLYAQNMIPLITMVAPQLTPRLTDNLVRTRVALAADPTCPPVVLELLAYDTDNVVSAVTQNPRCPVTALATALEFRLGHYYGPTQRILAQIAVHPNINVPLLRRLAVDYSHLVVNHPLCPVELLVQFTQSPHPYVRECAVGRAAIPTEDLLRTIGDRDARVAAAIRVAVAQRGYDAVRRALLLMNARDRQRLTRILQPEDIARLATDVDERIRYAVTRCTDDPDLLRQLAADPHGRVRRAASDRVFMSLAS